MDAKNAEAEAGARTQRSDDGDALGGAPDTAGSVRSSEPGRAEVAGDAPATGTGRAATSGDTDGRDNPAGVGHPADADHPVDNDNTAGAANAAGSTATGVSAATAGSANAQAAESIGGAPEGRRMNVFIDARWTRTDTHDGISRYGANLIEALHQLHPVTMLIHDDRQLDLLPDGVPHVKINSPLSPRELWVSRTLNKLGAEVVFSPMQVIGGFSRRYKLILTLHDLIYYRHPQPPGFLPLPVQGVWRLYHKAYWPQRVLLNRADAVVTVSETTRTLMRHHRLTRRPITVVHNAPSELDSLVSAKDLVDPERCEGALTAAAGEDARNGAGGPRELVYMGSFMPYKNVETLVDGMALLSGYRLHLVSRVAPAREAELAERIPSGADVVFWRGISDGDYHELLSRAFALVTASKDEGFGLPIIEAMNAGTPVVCSDLTIFREVTGGHARFFQSDSPDGFAAAVNGLEDDAVRAELVESARVQAKQFTWTSSAERLLEVMHSVVR
ncbi:glycosyltransferase family 4 protein [Saccharopolyspora erythraea]|uniref:glycosyltransferase family 4 protein n=1 Tax=Saccharopolyspora erythraea TaxID=1836 RepID=UPI0020137B30|nr:glycosyltransferase family 1 protein [Saccharopolyspora erythraea]